jgi:serine/threonine protein kinase
MSKSIDIHTDFLFGSCRNYRLKNKIQDGGFGSVWELDDPKYVVKFGLKENTLSNEIVVLEKIQEKLKEKTNLKKYLKVPNLIETGYCMIQNERREYIVMQKLGPDLSYLKNFQFTTELNRVYAILRAGLQICKGLYILHTYLHLVHGDVKPSNFLFTEQSTQLATTENVAFIDLGLVRPVRSREIQSSGINGTRSYASIHVQKKYLPTPRCDLESLGYMLLGFIDYTLPWNREIKRQMKKDESIAERSEDSKKTRKEQIALGQKRALRERIMKEKYHSNGELLLAEYFYTVYQLPINPDQNSYKFLCKIFYSIMKRLQKLALESVTNKK